jgi:hypothetical protein
VLAAIFNYIKITLISLCNRKHNTALRSSLCTSRLVLSLRKKLKMAQLTFLACLLIILAIFFNGKIAAEKTLMKISNCEEHEKNCQTENVLTIIPNQSKPSEFLPSFFAFVCDCLNMKQMGVILYRKLCKDAFPKY